MDPVRIAELLQPFFAGASPALDGCHSEPASVGEGAAVLCAAQLQSISTYIDILIRWNARINLTAVRQPDQVVTRHFGESLFAARHLFPSAQTTWGQPPSPALSVGEGAVQAELSSPPHLIDVGSGAGFPGLPIKIYAPHIQLTLIESNQKKATFLREVARSLTLTYVDVFVGRAEHFTAQADVVALRAIERFEAVLPIAARLVAPVSRLALLIGRAQVDRSFELTPDFRWADPIPIPLSSSRVLLIGSIGNREHQAGHVLR
jgi:16S rRNA (guanine527-N7)-methyltransferase